MNKLAHGLCREARVALSLKAQPLWFRIFKWTCIFAALVLFHDRRWFWWALVSLATAGILMHFLYRCKTKAWTRAWGGWNDLEAGRD